MKTKKDENKTLLFSNPRPGLRHQELNLKIRRINRILKFRVKISKNLRQICISLGYMCASEGKYFFPARLIIFTNTLRIV